MWYIQLIDDINFFKRTNMPAKLNVPAVLIFLIPGVLHNNIPFASVKLIGARNQNEKAFNLVSKMV